MPSRDGNNFGKFTTWTPRDLPSPWVNGWHPKSHMMHSKARPRGKVWTQAGQQKANPSAWPAEGKLPTCPLCVRFPETPKYSHSKKNSPITMQTAEESCECKQLSTQIFRYSTPTGSTGVQPSHQVVDSTGDLFLLGWCLQLHVDLTFRLRFGVRKSVHQLEAMPHPCYKTKNTKKNIQKFNFFWIIFKLTILD